MSHKDNMDLRNTGDGGWFYAEHELFSVFAPLIGPLGVSVYMAMCRLIPLAAVDPERQVTERAVMEAACVTKGTANRKMAEIVALGMVLSSGASNRRTPTYKLPSLRTLALVGIAELESRLGGPRWTTEKEGSVGQPTDKAAAEGANAASPRGDASQEASTVGSKKATAPAASGENGGPGGTTRRPAVEMTLKDLLVVQKTPLVVQKTPLVVQNRGPLFKEEKEEEEYPPVVPQGGRVSSLSASADGNHDKSKNQKPSHDAKDQAAKDLEAAVAKVQRECSLSGRRIGGVIEAAMRLEAGKADDLADWNAIAERMIRSYDGFLKQQEFMAFKVLAPRFFAELWADNRKWPWDEKALREGRRL